MYNRFRRRDGIASISDLIFSNGRCLTPPPPPPYCCSKTAPLKTLIYLTT